MRIVPESSPLAAYFRSMGLHTKTGRDDSAPFLFFVSSRNCFRKYPSVFHASRNFQTAEHPVSALFLKFPAASWAFHHNLPLPAGNAYLLAAARTLVDMVRLPLSHQALLGCPKHPYFGSVPEKRLVFRITFCVIPGKHPEICINKGCQRNRIQEIPPEKDGCHHCRQCASQQEAVHGIRTVHAVSSLHKTN